MRLTINTMTAFEAAMRSGAFKAATDVWLYNLPGITAVPDLPAATDVWLDNLPGITAVPKVATRGRIYRNGRVWR